MRRIRNIFCTCVAISLIACGAGVWAFSNDADVGKSDVKNVLTVLDAFPRVSLHDMFRFQLDGVDRHGFLDEHGMSLEGVEAYAMSSISISPDDSGDEFPRGGAGIERRSYLDEKSGIRITYERLFYDRYPVSETIVWFENVSEHNSPNLKDVLIFDGSLPTGGAPKLTTGYGEDADPHRNYALERLELQVGESHEFEPREAYPSFGAFPFFLIEGEERSYIVAIGWTGRWTASAVADKDGNVLFTAGQKGVDLYLKPGEKIRTPRFTLFEFPTGTDATNLWRDWYRRYIMPREDGLPLRPKFALDVFYKGELYDKVTPEEQIAAIKKLRALGYPCEALWVDAGWYLRPNAIDTCVGKWFGVGDWTPDPTRFPNGFRPVVDELENVPEGEKKGELVLWFEPERVHRSKLNDDLKQYVVPDCEIIESYRMNMASSKTVEYLSNTIGEALRTNGVSIYRQDSNGAGPLPFIESLEANDPEYQNRKGYAENRYVCGLYEFWEILKRTNPNLLFDSCASGGRRNDLEMLRIGAVPLHYSDVGYFDFVEKQHMHDTLNRWFIYYKNIDPHDYDFEKGTYNVYKTTIDMAPFSTVRPYFLDNPSPETRNYADRYFNVRNLLVDGDYYLLRGNFTEDDWCVWQFDDSRQLNSAGYVVDTIEDALTRYLQKAPQKYGERQVGCVLCVRNEKNEEDEIVVSPRRVDPTARYEWENLETHKKIVVSGETLAKGIKVALPKRSGAVYKYAKLK